MQHVSLSLSVCLTLSVDASLSQCWPIHFRPTPIVDTALGLCSITLLHFPWFAVFHKVQIQLREMTYLNKSVAWTVGEVYCHRAQQADHAREPAANRKLVCVCIIYICDNNLWCSAANRKLVCVYIYIYVCVITICGAQLQIESLCS